jgi:hypothetical protein
MSPRYKTPDDLFVVLVLCTQFIASDIYFLYFEIQAVGI